MQPRCGRSRLALPIAVASPAAPALAVPVTFAQGREAADPRRTTSPTGTSASARWPATRTAITASANASSADPKVIVLHFTATDSYDAVWSTFNSNAPNVGELPGVCSHYVIEQDGTIDELVPPRLRCRHTIGLNHVAIGIEMVQSTGRGSHWADQQILDRKRQSRAALRLVRWLQDRYSIPTGEVIGHSMANDDPLLQGPRGLAQRPHGLAEARRPRVPQAAEALRLPPSDITPPPAWFRCHSARSGVARGWRLGGERSR